MKPAPCYFSIVKNTPAPNNKVNGLYPFAGMEVGDAFDAPRDMGSKPNGNDRRMAAVSSAAYNWSRRHNPTVKFHVWCLDENAVRCRRMK